MTRGVRDVHVQHVRYAICTRHLAEILSIATSKIGTLITVQRVADIDGAMLLGVLWCIVHVQRT